MGAQHTPGPWRLDDYNTIRADRPNDDDAVPIATWTCSPLGLDHAGSCTRPVIWDEAVANARLIAAAPDLLEALELLCAKFDIFEGEPFHNCSDSPWAIARAAIAKAKGLVA